MSNNISTPVLISVDKTTDLNLKTLSTALLNLFVNSSTTEEMIQPSTLNSLNKDFRRTSYSSRDKSLSEASLYSSTRASSSKIPKVMLVFPISAVSNIKTSPLFED
ncbi:unknown [Clostridium sp. CAG:729]|nr:unknown [Clostridium sp. CAG:729]